MTKKLEDILNLPNVKEAFKEVDKKEQARANEDQKTKVMKNVDPQTAKNLEKSYREFDKVAAALPQVKGLGELSDLELDKLAIEAEESYKNLMDLGMNVESRYGGRVFEVAGSMLKTSLDAKVAKMDKKLKMIELQLKKEKLDKDNAGIDGDIVSGEGYVVTDRNSLIEKLKNMDK